MQNNMSLIVYSKNNSKSEYGIKQIDNTLFKKLMYNEIHKKSRFTIPKEKIIKEFDISFNNNEENYDVLFMAELDELQLNSYLELYQDEKDNLDKYIEFLSITTYNQINPDKFKIKKKFNTILSSLSEYWEDPNNCNYTLTHKFNERRFNNINYNGNMDIIKNSINKSNFEIDWNSREINYLNDVIKFNDWKEMCIKKYYVSNISKFINEDIINIYNQLSSEYMKYMFICNMLCSRTHCHLILNNFEFLKISKPLFDKYKLILKYLIGYAWITLKNEEYHIYHKMNDSDRIIFDINTANLLPIFPFTYDDINQNPYASILINNEILDMKKNCLTFEMMKNYEKYYGVCTSEEFERRLNIFVNNSNKKGILDVIDWSSCAISGSVMTACGMKYNPLFDSCKTDNNMNVLNDNDLADYFFHYYNDSDIDLICNKKSIYEFIDVVNDFINNTNKNYNNVSVTNIHTGTMILSEEFIIDELENINKILKLDSINVNFIKSNFNNQDIKNYFYNKYYIPWKNEQSENIKNMNNKFNNELIKDYLKPIPAEEFRLYTLDYDLDEEKYIKQDYEKYFYQNDKLDVLNEQNKMTAKLSENIRFKITNPNTRTFEIFKSRDTNFFSMVSRFHMGFVRAIWTGKTVLCLPSYITSMMLQLAVDYKYFASIRDPIEIVNKYRSRGFGIILNNYEKIHMAYYNSTKLKDSTINEKWIEIYKINLKSKHSIENIFGTKKTSDDIFKPSKFFMGLPDDCFKDAKHETCSTFDECFNSLITLTPSLLSISKYKAINDEGKINPLSRDIINTVWNLLNPLSKNIIAANCNELI
jgi:hypothetical protein